METKNLTIRTLTLDDVDQVYTLTSLDEVAKYMRFGKHENKLQTQELITEYTQTPGYKSFVLEEKTSGAFVGIFVLKQDDPDASIYSMTTFNHPKFWNKGYGVEVLAAMKHYAYHDLQAKRLRAYVVSHNIGSCKVLEKNGFTKIDILTFENLDGELYVYELKHPNLVS